MQRVPVLTAAAAATVLLCPPAVAGAQTIKTATGGPLTTQTAGSNGTPALSNLTLSVPQAVIAKYGAIAQVIREVVNQLGLSLQQRHAQASR